MELLNEVSEECSKNCGLLKIWVGPLPFLLITHPQKADEVLRFHLEKDDNIRILRNLTGDGSLFAKVSLWRRRRKVMVSALHPKVILKHFDTFLELSKKLADDIALAVSDKKPFNIYPYLNSYSFNVTCEIAMGKNNFFDENKVYITKILDILKNYIIQRFVNFWQNPDWLYYFHPNYTKTLKYREATYSIVDEVVRQKRNEYNNNEDGSQNKYLIDNLISFSRKDKEYSDTELREEMISLFIASTDTCTNVLDIILILFAKYPKVQERVYEELHAAFHDQDMLPITKEDLSKLEYLERVINETLRLYPPAPFVIRKNAKKTVFSDGKILPENSRLLVSLWGLHRNPDYWGPDAACFDPDRFLPNRYSRVQSGCFIPFLIGSRNCPGFTFAMMSLKTALCVLLKNYKVVPDPEVGPIPNIRLKYEITLTAVGSRVALEARC